MNVLKVSQALDVKACRVAIVVSMFNEFITGRLESGCLKHLLKKGVLENHITIVEVPGAVELPLVAKKISTIKKI